MKFRILSEGIPHRQAGMQTSPLSVGSVKNVYLERQAMSMWNITQLAFATTLTFCLLSMWVSWHVAKQVRLSMDAMFHVDLVLIGTHLLSEIPCGRLVFETSLKLGKLSLMLILFSFLAFRWINDFFVQNCQSGSSYKIAKSAWFLKFQLMH